MTSFFRPLVWPQRNQSVSILARINGFSKNSEAFWNEDLMELSAVDENYSYGFLNSSSFHDLFNLFNSYGYLMNLISFNLLFNNSYGNDYLKLSSFVNAFLNDK
jgi:hypothetical protein